MFKPLFEWLFACLLAADKRIYKQFSQMKLCFFYSIGTEQNSTHSIMTASIDLYALTGDVAR